MIPKVQLSFVDACSPELVLKEADQPANSLSNRKRQRNTVTFSETVQCRSIVDPEDYQASDTWYNHFDYKSFTDDRRMNARMMQLDAHSDETRFCTRGLEHYSQDAYDTRNIAKARAHNAVMDQQDICRHEGSHFSADLIARAYANETRCRRMAAYLKGIADESSVAEFLKYKSSDSIQYKSTDTRSGVRRSELPPLAPTRQVSGTPRAA